MKPWLSIISVLGAVGISYLVAKDNLEKNPELKQVFARDIPYPKDINVKAEASKVISLYVSSIKYKNFKDFCKCLSSELITKEEVNSPQVSEFFYYNNFKAVFKPIVEFSGNQKVDIQKLGSVKVLKAYIFEDWAKNNVYEYLDLPTKEVIFKAKLKNIIMAECVVTYDSISKVGLLFLKYDPKTQLWQIHRSTKGTVNKFLKFLKDNIIMFYSNQCKLLLERGTISKMDENGIFEDFLVEGRITSNRLKNHVSSIGIDLDVFDKLYDKIWYETKLTIEALQGGKCSWYIEYSDGYPIALYMAHDDVSELVGGYNIETRHYQTERTIGGIWASFEES